MWEKMTCCHFFYYHVSLCWNMSTISSLFVLVLLKHFWPFLIHPDRHITHVLYRRKSWLLLSPSSQVKHFIPKLNLSLIQCSTMFSPQKVTLSSPTCINTDKGAFGNVIQATDTPALVLGLEELQTNLQAMLYQSVCAHVRVTFAAFVTLINSGRRSQ